MEPVSANRDPELIRRTLAGEREAYDQLVERHMGLVFAIAVARLRDRERAEDLAQEVFLRAYLALDQLSDHDRYPAWLGQITRNLAINWLRRQGRIRRLAPEVPLGEEVHNLPDTQATGVREHMENQERESAVWKSVQSLPTEEREMVLLHYSEGITTREIGERLGVDQSTVSRRIQKALRQMKGTLEPMLRESAPALRAPQRVTMRTLSVIAGAAAMSAVSKTALAAKATQDVSALTQATTGSLFSLNALWAALIMGGKAMATGKGIVATVVAALAVGGGVAIMNSGSQQTSPSNGAGGVVADGLPTLYIVPADDPNAPGVQIPRHRAGDTPSPMANLGENLRSGFMRIEPNPTLRLEGDGIDLDELMFVTHDLSAQQGIHINTPEITELDGPDGPWLLTFTEPLQGHLFNGLYDTPNGGTEQTWLLTIEGAGEPDPGVVAEMERIARGNFTESELAAIDGNVDAAPTISGVPNLQIIPPLGDPRGGGVWVRPSTMEEIVDFASNLSAYLENNSLPLYPAYSRLLIEGTGFDVDDLRFTTSDLGPEREEKYYEPTIRSLGDSGTAWVVEFDEPLTGHLFAMVMENDDTQMAWIMAIEGASAPDPSSVAAVEQEGREEMTRSVNSRQPATPNESHMQAVPAGTPPVLRVHDPNGVGPEIPRNTPRDSYELMANLARNLGSGAIPTIEPDAQLEIATPGGLNLSQWMFTTIGLQTEGQSWLHGPVISPIGVTGSHFRISFTEDLTGNIMTVEYNGDQEVYLWHMLLAGAEAPNPSVVSQYEEIFQSLIPQ